MNLRNYLREQVRGHEGAERLDEEQIDNISKGLEWYIYDYLAEQIPEQIASHIEEDEELNS